MKVLVCGGLHYADWGQVRGVLDALLAQGMNLLLEGGAGGADFLARQWWAEKAADRLFGVAHITYPAEWAKHGKAAGPVRNRRMLEEVQPDVVVAFPGGRGTANMVALARKAGVRVIEIVAEEAGK